MTFAAAFRRARAVVAGLLLLTLAVLVAPAAQAHDMLIDSRPAAGEVLSEAPDAVVLTFNNPPLAVGSAITVVDASGATVAQGEGTVEGAEVLLPLSEPLPSGDLEVRWRVASSDGHPIEGTIAFTLDAPAAQPTASAAPTAEPAATPEPTTAEPAAAPTAEAEETGLAGLPTWLKVAVGVAALGAVAGLVVLVARRLREDRL
ncbi:MULTISPECIES: copper resistance CopC family protein [Georgenia]|nr:MULTISPECIES: copper resistance CopC family protein [Georgenia]